MNSEEFRAFYRRYYDVSVKLASRIVQSHFTAEDVTQEVIGVTMMSQLNLQAELYRVILQRRMLHRKYFYIFTESKTDLICPAKESCIRW